MNRNRPPRDLVLDLTERGDHRMFMMAAVIADSRGIFSWGWNHKFEKIEDGNSTHAEVHTIRRANRSRLAGATIYVAGKKRNNGEIILAKPCPVCQRRILKTGITRIIYSNPESPTGWSILFSQFVSASSRYY